MSYLLLSLSCVVVRLIRYVVRCLFRRHGRPASCEKCSAQRNQQPHPGMSIIGCEEVSAAYACVCACGVVWRHMNASSSILTPWPVQQSAAPVSPLLSYDSSRMVISSCESLVEGGAATAWAVMGTCGGRMPARDDGLCHPAVQRRRLVASQGFNSWRCFRE